MNISIHTYVRTSSNPFSKALPPFLLGFVYGGRTKLDLPKPPFWGEDSGRTFSASGSSNIRCTVKDSDSNVSAYAVFTSKFPWRNSTTSNGRNAEDGDLSISVLEYVHIMCVFVLEGRKSNDDCIQYVTAHCDAAQQSRIQYVTEQNGAFQLSTVRFSTVQYSIV